MSVFWGKKGIIFDLDGVLWDSSAVHAQAFHQVCVEAGLAPVEYRTIAGMRTDEAFKKILSDQKRPISETVIADLTAKKRAAALAQLTSNPPLFPRVGSTMAWLSACYQLGLATASSRANAMIFMTASKTTECFEVSVCGDEVARGKPDPEIYRTTCERMGLKPQEVVVIEDAVQGIRAAKAAGMDVVGVLGTHDQQDLLNAGATHVVGSIADLLALTDHRMIASGKVPEIVQASAESPQERSRWTVLIPAAGRGTRLGYDKPKILYPIDGKPIVEWLIDAVGRVCEKMVFVLSPDGAPVVRPVLERLIPGRFEIAIQTEPLGMGHAVASGIDAVKTPGCLIVWGDQVTVSPATLAKCTSACDHFQATAAIPTVKRQVAYINFARDPQGRLVRVDERREGTQTEDTPGESDCGVFACQTDAVRKALAWGQATGKNRGPGTGEANFLPLLPYLETLGNGMVTLTIDDEWEAVGINTADDASAVAAALRKHGSKRKES